MRRCIELAERGLLSGALPNPLVGAVIVGGGRIIGEGFHVRCGEGHAEVNAFASVRPEDEGLVRGSTLYVSLEPCSHYGRTPPCCELIARRGVARVVVGCVDSFEKVCGSGIAFLRSAGVDVTVGVLEDECRWLNRRFFTFHERRRPYIILKWAQSEDGFIDDGGRACCFSSPFTRMLVHKLRSEEQAILVGRVTDEREHPQLTVRHWSGVSPVRFVLGGGVTIDDILRECCERGLQSLVVEGGGRTLQSFLDGGLWDEIRVETAAVVVGGGTRAPQLPQDLVVIKTELCDGNIIMRGRNCNPHLTSPY